MLRLSALLGLVLGPLFVAPVLALTGRPLQENSPVLVIGSMSELPDILRRADGRQVGPTRTPIAMLATSDGDNGRFSKRLKAEGAWLVIDGSLAAKICGFRDD